MRSAVRALLCFVVAHYNDVIMGAMASEITSLTIVYSTVYSSLDQRKHQSSASLAFLRGIHRWPVNSPHKWPVKRKMFPFDDVIMWYHSILPMCFTVSSLTLMQSCNPIADEDIYIYIYIPIRNWYNPGETQHNKILHDGWSCIITCGSRHTPCIVESRYVAVRYSTILHACNSTLTTAEYRSDFELTKCTPYLALTGQLWRVYREYCQQYDWQLSRVKCTQL